MPRKTNKSLNYLLRNAKKSENKGNINSAIKLYDLILLQYPKNIPAKTALQKLQGVLIEPSQAQLDAIINLYRLGKVETTMHKCLELLNTYPHSISILNLLGVTLQNQDKFDEALIVFNKIIRLKPNFFGAYNNIGICLRSLGNLNEALEGYNKAIKLKKDFSQAYYNRGIALQELKRHNDAIESYTTAINYNSNYAFAYSNLGSALNHVGKYEESIQNLNQAIKLNPNNAEAYTNRADVYLNLEQLQHAVEDYKKAIGIDSSCYTAYGNLNMALNYDSKFSQKDVFEQHLNFGKQFKNTALRKESTTYNNSKIKIGYVSADFRSHSVSYFFEPLLKTHNKNKFEVYCYYNDNQVDDTTKRLMSESQHWRNIANLNDKQVVNLIKKDKIDILIDLSGHTSKNRLCVFAKKPAHIQISWLGYPNTTGLEAMDYRFTDNIADPVGVTDHLYTEKLIRIPNGFLCYQGDDSIAFNNIPPCVNNKFITFGSFNNLHKVTNQVIEVWSKILLSVPNSRLIIKSKNLLNKTTRSNLLNKFKCEGISTDRITLHSSLPTKKDHLALYDSIDIALDTFPYNGATTTCEALWMGIPVITFLGKVHAARVGGSILTQTKLEDLVANDVNMYINTSIKLAKNIEDIIKLRRVLRSNMKKSTLCDAKLFTKHIETEYQRMYKIDK